VRVNPFLTVFLAYGSAATLFFWTKWMGKIITMKEKPANFKANIPFVEEVTLSTLAFLTVVITLAFPLISRFNVEPYLIYVFGNTVNLGHGNTVIMLTMMALMILLPLRLYFYKDLNYVEAYLGGSNVEEVGQFLGSFGEPRELKFKNYYMESYFGEVPLARAGVYASVVLIIIMFGVQII
jgi:ech hydrogenase subunit A